MGIGLKTCILAVALLLFGAARMPFEAALNKDLRRANLFPPKLEVGTLDRIGQTSSAVALGGLRTLVATFLNLRAFTFFTEKKWVDVGKTFNLIVDLAPRTRYYWETGSWHQAYNAASYYLNDSELPPLRRKEAWRSSIKAGKAFLERGVRNVPDDWSLHASIGFLLSDANKFPAFGDPDKTFAEAAEAYRKADEAGNALAYVRRARFYALARARGHEAEALAFGRALYAESKRNHTPTLLMLLLVLEAWENPDLDTSSRAIELFGTPEKALESLSGHWMRTRERFPVYGIAKGIESLERQLKVQPEDSAFKKTPPPMMDPDDVFNR